MEERIALDLQLRPHPAQLMEATLPLLHTPHVVLMEPRPEQEHAQTLLQWTVARDAWDQQLTLWLAQLMEDGRHMDPGQAALEVVVLDLKPDTEHAQRQLHSMVDRIVSVKPVNLRNADTTVHVSIYYLINMQIAKYWFLDDANASSLFQDW